MAPTDVPWLGLKHVQGTNRIAQLHLREVVGGN